MSNVDTVSISVIVPAYNAAATLDACLRSLFGQTLRPVEVIVVDDASVDDTVAVALRCGAKVLRRESNGGPGMARNDGARSALGDILAFTDADCIAPADWLERMVAAASEPGVVAATGGYGGPACDGFLPMLQHLAIRERQASLPNEIESTITSNLVCRASAFHAAGGFPRYFRRFDLDRPVWGNEDEELGYLISRTGKVRWVSEDGVRHAFRRTAGGFLRQQAFYAERIVMSHFRFLGMAASRTNYSRRSGLLHLGVTLAVTVGTLLIGGCAVIGSSNAMAENGVDVFCTIVAAALVTIMPLFLLLPLPVVRYLRRQGMSAMFVLRAYPVLVAIELAWLYGAIRGTFLSLGGFIDGHDTTRAAPAAPDR